MASEWPRIGDLPCVPWGIKEKHPSREGRGLGVYEISFGFVPQWCKMNVTSESDAINKHNSTNAKYSVTTTNVKWCKSD